MHLELDAGNTRIKWRVVEGETTLNSGSDLKQQLDQIDPKSLASVWVSSVHTEQNAWIAATFPQAAFAETSKQKAGLLNSYQDVSRMGVDRWLAMLAAYADNPDGDHIIVDAGTALTIDVISQHRHVGGYICPGIYLMKQSILGKTQQIFAEDEWLSGRSPGESTQECLDHGVLDMACSWIESRCQYYPKATVWLTGGDAEKLAPLLNRSLVLEPDLVLNGLKVHFSQ